jgi:hypothetical protein
MCSKSSSTKGYSLIEVRISFYGKAEVNSCKSVCQAKAPNAVSTNRWLGKRSTSGDGS